MQWESERTASPSLIECWTTSVREHPDDPALESSGSAYTFREADELSTTIATGIREEFPAPSGTLIGAFLGHSAVDLITLLALMKADRVVVCLDSHLPPTRLQQIAHLAGITSCIVADDLWPVFVDVGLADLYAARVGELRDAHRRSTSTARVDGALGPRVEDAVAIAFTSGSTGNPKGVIQSNEVLFNEALVHHEELGVSCGDRVALVLPISFAAGLSVSFGALLNGALLSCFDPRDQPVRGLITWINDHRLNTLQCSPHLLRALADAMQPGEMMSSLTRVETVGESVHSRDVIAIREHLSADSSFFNWVGSSESGALTVHEIPADAPVPSGPIPGGHVVSNKEIVLLDDGRAVPRGGSGEIVVYSRYLSGGYWQDEEQNALRFDTHVDGRGVYRLGDLGKFDENGDLRLLGRGDSALKIRGYLVEPSEVESAFLTIDAVGEVAIVPVPSETGSATLVAYVAPRSGVRLPSSAALRRSLRDLLPEYMVPAEIVPLVELPRTERGKVDRTQLPPVTVTEYEPVTEDLSPMERELGTMWAEVLGLPHVGLDEDFMARGGDSLSAEELLAKVEARFGIDVTSTQLLQAPTVREFAVLMTKEAPAPLDPDMIRLRSGAQQPVFCFAGAGGLALVFDPFSRYLAGHDVYAFQSHGLEKRAIPDWSVESAARRFVGLMRSVQPSGPYVLAGFSYGGLLALEAAKQLRENGESVRLVCLLDTYLPRSEARQRELERAMSGVTDPFPVRWARTLRRPIDAALPDGLPGLEQVGRRVRGHLAGILRFSGQRQFDALFDHGTITARRYRAQPYDGSTLLVLAESPDQVEQWDPLLIGPKRVLHLNSEHTAIMREPLVRLVAEALLAELEQDTGEKSAGDKGSSEGSVSPSEKV